MSYLPGLAIIEYWETTSAGRSLCASDLPQPVTIVERIPEDSSHSSTVQWSSMIHDALLLNCGCLPESYQYESLGLGDDDKG